jgi:hypothetical protein
MSRWFFRNFLAQLTRDGIVEGWQAAQHDIITGEAGQSTRTVEEAAAFRQMVSGQSLETNQPTVTIDEVPQLPEVSANPTQTSLTEPRKGPGRPRKQLEPPK